MKNFLLKHKLTIDHIQEVRITKNKPKSSDELGKQEEAERTKTQDLDVIFLMDYKYLAWSINPQIYIVHLI